MCRVSELFTTVYVVAMELCGIWLKKHRILTDSQPTFNMFHFSSAFSMQIFSHALRWQREADPRPTLEASELGIFFAQQARNHGAADE